MSAAAQQPPVMDRSIAEVLDGIGRETWDLHLAAVKLQTLAGELIDRARLAANDPLIEEAQALDALAQKLDALTGYLDRLSQSAPDGWRLDIGRALEPVFLADLAKRLCRQQSAEDESLAPAGDFELF